MHQWVVRGSHIVTATPIPFVRRYLPIIAFLGVSLGAVVAPATAAEAPVDLGTARSFAVLAGSAITNTGPTTISGDVGIHPGSAVTGFGSVTHHGSLHVADAVAEAAKRDLVTAYNDAAGRGPATTVATDLGGDRLTPGVYDSASGTFELTGTLTLDAQGDSGAVFIFQTASTLVTASNSSVRLVNEADVCNVYWQVGSSATLGTGTSFAGNILALQSITLNTGATIDGRALARNGAVTMDTNTITRATCTRPVVQPSATPTTGTPTTGPTTTATPTDGPTATATPTDTTPTPTATLSASPPGGTATGGGTPPATGTATTAPPAAIPPPSGGVETGGGSTAGIEHLGVMIAGSVLLIGAATALIARRRPPQSGAWG